MSEGKTTKVKMPRAARIGRINTSAGVAVEMARIYRKARLVEMDIDSALKLVRILAELRNALDQSEVEKRIAEVESRIAAAMSSSVTPFRRSS